MPSSPFKPQPQPKRGNIHRLRQQKYNRYLNLNQLFQLTLNKSRIQLLPSLNQTSFLRATTDPCTGSLRAPSPPTRKPLARSKLARPSIFRRQSKTKSRLHAQAAHAIMARNRFRMLWNDLTEREVREDEWVEYDRVKLKLWDVLRKYRFRDGEVVDISEVEFRRRCSVESTWWEERRVEAERNGEVAGGGKQRVGEF